MPTSLHTWRGADDRVDIAGTAFTDAIVSPVPIYVDGDLVCPAVTAPQITVIRGSLLCPMIHCPVVHAEILGVWDWTQPFILPVDWAYTWLRPVDALPTADAWASDTSIFNVLRLLADPRIVLDPWLAAPFLSKIRARPTCARARILFQSALEDLVMAPGALTPFGRQVILTFTRQPRLPQHWRY